MLGDGNFAILGTCYTWALPACCAQPCPCGADDHRAWLSPTLQGPANQSTRLLLSKYKTTCTAGPRSPRGPQPQRWDPCGGEDLAQGAGWGPSATYPSESPRCLVPHYPGHLQAEERLMQQQVLGTVWGTSHAVRKGMEAQSCCVLPTAQGCRLVKVSMEASIREGVGQGCTVRGLDGLSVLGWKGPRHTGLRHGARRRCGKGRRELSSTVPRLPPPCESRSSCATRTQQWQRSSHRPCEPPGSHRF